MAGENEWTDHPLARSLIARARKISFFEVVRQVQSHLPDAPRVGTQGPPGREPLRFRGHLSLAFPGSDVTEIHPAGSRLEVTTTFLGIYGATSPLPTFYTEDLLHKETEDSLVRGFLDLFNHRMISLFYRVWEKYRYPIQFRPGGTDGLSRRLVGLLGFDPDVSLPDLAIPPVRLLAYAGLLTPSVRSASALRGILADHFPGVPVEIEECTGQFLQVPGDQRSRLGQGACSLGEDLVLGDRVFDSASAFGIRLGPMDWDDYRKFLPGGDYHHRLRELVRVFNSDRLDYDVEVRIRREALPEARLSGDKTRLGWSAWLAGSPERDPFVRFHEKG